MKRIGMGLLIVAVLASCLGKKESLGSLKTGNWRAIIEIQGQDLPFNLEIVKDSTNGYDAYLRNADERLLLDEVTVVGDIVSMELHVFDATIKAQIKGDILEGQFIKNFESDYKLPFRAEYGKTYRFERGAAGENAPDFTGKYAVTFIRKAGTTPAIGVFNQIGDSVTGTFLTTTGDYRYLEGNVVNGTLYLSTFDGNHAYLFMATKQPDGTLKGRYYSGKARNEDWIAIRNESATLPDAEKLTYLKEGYDHISFSFPDVTGKKVSLTDVKYKNQVVILQLFGTWCPNCMDETKFLKPWYDKNKDRGIEIIGLAYERKADFDYASSRIKKMIEKFDVRYDFVIAGTHDKASETLPMLNKVAAFPTTIFIGKDGKVKKIHTGFSGPGTGKYYDEFIQHFNETVNELLSENYTSIN
jgi:thiol-disulfide isomerase/thioredoxin